jgi:hypothetical protein
VVNGRQAAPDVGGLVNAIVVVVVVVFCGWLLLAWAIVKRPLLGVPAAVFTGLVALVGCMTRKLSRSTSALRCWCGGGRTAHRLTG